MEYVREIVKELKQLDEVIDKRFLCQLYIMIRHYKKRNCR